MQGVVKDVIHEADNTIRKEERSSCVPQLSMGRSSESTNQLVLLTFSESLVLSRKVSEGCCIFKSVLD